MLGSDYCAVSSCLGWIWLCVLAVVRRIVGGPHGCDLAEFEASGKDTNEGQRNPF